MKTTLSAKVTLPGQTVSTYCSSGKWGDYMPAIKKSCHTLTAQISLGLAKVNIRLGFSSMMFFIACSLIPLLRR